MTCQAEPGDRRRRILGGSAGERAPRLSRALSDVRGLLGRAGGLDAARAGRCVRSRPPAIRRASPAADLPACAREPHRGTARRGRQRTSRSVRPVVTRSALVVDLDPARLAAQPTSSRRRAETAGQDGWLVERLRGLLSLPAPAWVAAAVVLLALAAGLPWILGDTPPPAPTVAHREAPAPPEPARPAIPQPPRGSGRVRREGGTRGAGRDRAAADTGSDSGATEPRGQARADTAGGSDPGTCPGATESARPVGRRDAATGTRPRSPLLHGRRSQPPSRRRSSSSRRSGSSPSASCLASACRPAASPGSLAR